MKRSVLQVIVDAFDKIAADDMDLELPAAQMIVDRLGLEGYSIVKFLPDGTADEQGDA